MLQWEEGSLPVQRPQDASSSLPRRGRVHVWLGREGKPSPLLRSNGPSPLRSWALPPPCVYSFGLYVAIPRNSICFTLSSSSFYPINSIIVIVIVIIFFFFFFPPSRAEESLLDLLRQSLPSSLMEGSTSTVEGKQQQPPSPASTPAGDADEKAGTKYMGPPAAPSAHPHNQRAATWSAAHDDVPGPYRLLGAPVEKSSSSPMETILDLFNTWTKKAETVASNVWLNRKC